MYKILATALFTAGLTTSLAILKENGQYLWLGLLFLAAFGLGALCGVQVMLHPDDDRRLK